MRERTTSRRFGFLLGAALPALLLATGCDKDSASPEINDPVSQTEDIDDPFGGFNTSDEMVGFDDPYLLSDEGELDYEDDIIEDPDVRDLIEDSATWLFGVRLTWGYLDRDSTHSDDPVDWSGSAMVDSGALIAVRTIQFEPGQDYLLRPSEGPVSRRRVVEWVSTTTVAFDGVQLRVADPTSGQGPNSLTLSVPLLDKTFEIAELAEMDTTFLVDEAGHQFRVQARRLEPGIQCRHGWLSGRWEQLDPQTDAEALQRRINGRFRGHWTDAYGDVGGFLRGFYGVNARGYRVYFGKLIDRNGAFVGLVRGTWDHSLHTPGSGPFRGVWLDEEERAFGAMRGLWERRGPSGDGFFHGAWRSWCGDVDEEIDSDIF